MQNTADAAALAGGDILLEGGLVSEAKAAALQMAQNNGYDNADPDVTVTVNIPPTSGPNSGDSDYVEVIVEHPVDAVVSRALGKTSWDMSARAVSGLDRSPKPYAIIALNETACGTMEFNGTINVTVSGGAGTFNNSECWPDALEVDGTVIVDDLTNDIVGGWDINANSDIDPPPRRAGHIVDPLAQLDEPIAPSGPVRACPTWSGQPGTEILQPGVYDCIIDPTGSWDVRFLPGDYLITGGIVLDGNNDAVFGAGIYTLRGVGLRIIGNGTISGDGVMFYIDEGQVVLTGTGDMDLTAPTTGDYAGVLIFQNRTLTSTVDLSGNAIADSWGAVYALSAEISLVGNTNTSFQFISDTFSMSGNSDVTINFDGGFLGTAPVMHLVE
jgi:hypothetical protein